MTSPRLGTMYPQRQSHPSRGCRCIDLFLERTGSRLPLVEGVADVADVAPAGSVPGQHQEPMREGGMGGICWHDSVDLRASV